MRSNCEANVLRLMAAFLFAWFLTPLDHPNLNAGDWPQILGPARNGIAENEKLAPRWPRSGPPVLWEKAVGAGYAGLAVVGDKAVLFHRRGDQEIVEGLDVATGKTLYQDASPTSFEPQVGGENGPLCVPVIHGNRVITFGAQGLLTCLDFQTGRRLWQRDTHRDFDAPEGYFGAGSCPIVVDGLVVVNVGGSRKQAGIVAFDLETGATVWAKSREPASYAAPVRASLDGKELVMMVTRYQCQLLDPKTGLFLFQFPFGARGPTVNAACPLVLEDHLLVTASYGVGMVYGKFNQLGFQQIVRAEGPISTQYCTPIFHDGYLYVIDGRDDVPPADLKCVEVAALKSENFDIDQPALGRQASGPVKWIEEDFGYGTLLLADDKLIAIKSNGEMLLISPTPERLKVISRSRPLRGTVRALPALSNGRLLIRNSESLKCLDLRPGL